jgi:hypothetical protein
VHADELARRRIGEMGRSGGGDHGCDATGTAEATGFREVSVSSE